MFQFTNYSLLLLCIYNKILEVCSSGFPHSDIHGSMDICSSPRLFAAYHVLLRLSVPRHSPYALGRLTRNIFLFNCQVSNVVLVGLGGLEPPTSRLSGVRSNQLSYGSLGIPY